MLVVLLIGSSDGMPKVQASKAPIQAQDLDVVSR
jgi:hypothetical protein